MRITLHFILAALLAVALGVAHAQTVSSSSFATTGSVSVSGVVGNGYGYDSQKSGASAWNSSGAYSTGIHANLTGGTANTGAYSEGGTSSYVHGVNVGNAFGASGALGVQKGSAEAIGGGISFYGIYGAESEAKVGSASGAANINNGFAANGTYTKAWNESEGGAYKSGCLFCKTTVGNTAGGTINLSGGIAWGAVGATGGYAHQTGTGFGF